MNIMAFVGAGLIGALLSAVLKQYKPEFGIYISLMTGMLILALAVTALSPALEMLIKLTDIAEINSQYGEILLKALAICYITQLACESCADAGEKAIASKIEFAGRCAITLLSLPLFGELVTVIMGYIS